MSAKRFYKQVSVAEADNGFRIELDGRPMKTPGKKPLRVPTKAVAEKIAAEWDAVETEINPSEMPVTRLTNVVSEAMPERREDLIAQSRSYAGTDLLSYRTSDPSDFVKRQAEAWDPWLDWAKERGVSLKTTTALIAIEQPEESLDAVAGFASGLDDFSLTLFSHLVAVYGSTILAFAVMEQALDPDTAFDLSRLDEIYRAEIWGEDEEDAERAQRLRAETTILGGLVKDL